MRTLEQIKKNKNWIACKKGYQMEPEGFSYEFLVGRFFEELKELRDKIYVDVNTTGNPFEIEWEVIPEAEFVRNEPVLEELADLSNIIDYIANKMTVNHPTTLSPEPQGDK